MYSKPALKRFGTFREITLGGTEPGWGDTSSYWCFFFTAPGEQPGPGSASTS